MDIYKYKWLTNFLIRFMVCFSSFAYSGGIFFWICEKIYIFMFDSSSRQRSPTKSDTLSNDWENPQVIGRNRRPPHVPLYSFKDGAEVRLRFRNVIDKAHKNVDDNRYYLTGLPGQPDTISPWKFSIVGSPDCVPTNWLTVGTNNSSWTNLQLPCHWQLNGFDAPIYTNTSYPFRFDPPRVQRDGTWQVALCDAALGGTPENSGMLSPKEPGPNATGLFRRTFILPSDWQLSSDRLFLVLEGVDSCVEVYLNGVSVGYSQDSCLPAEFEISSIIRSCSSGEALEIALKVMRWCDGSYLEDQDKWWLSGVYREVYILRKQSERIIADFETYSDLVWKNDSTNECESAKVTVSVLVEGPQRKNVAKEAVRAEIWDAFGSEPILVMTRELTDATGLPGRLEADRKEDPWAADLDLATYVDPGCATMTGLVPYPTLWTAETPTLYILVVSLHRDLASAKSRTHVRDTEGCTVGFREVAVFGPDAELCVNRVPIVCAGVNRHEFHCDRGRAVSMADMQGDISILKSLNFNSVRNSHYPVHPYWYDLCNQAGLYVVDEVNIETHGFQAFGQAVAYLSNHPDWRVAHLNRAARMYERDKNNPCVLIWSLGNESGVGAAHMAMHTWLRTRDPRRLIQYESGAGLSSVTDVVCPMYRPVEWCAYQALHDALRRPVILCEYAHMMGNSGGGLDKYWQLFRDQKFPRAQGGFIWDLIDQGLRLPSGGFGYGGDFQDLPNTFQFCCNGLLGPDRQPHPSALEAAFLQAPIGLDLTDDLSLLVTNLRQFMDLSDVHVEVRLLADREENSTALAEIHFECGALSPGQMMQKSLHLLVEGPMDVITASEVWVEAAAVLTVGTEWLPAGHILLKKCLQCESLTAAMRPKLPKSVPRIKEAPAVTIRQSDGLFHIVWPNKGSATVGATCGRLLSWDVHSIPMILEPLEPCLWRPATDNDRGGGPLSYAARWEAVGLAHLIVQECSVTATEKDGSVVLDCERHLSDNKNRFRVQCNTCFKFSPDGTVQVQQIVVPSADLPPLSRVGVRLGLPGGFSSVDWFGLGPHEAYDDRKSSVRLGRFASDVSDLHVPYVVPQECGRRADPRWVCLRDVSSGTGLMLIPTPTALPEAMGRLTRAEEVSGWGWSASRYSAEALEAAKHQHELSADKDKIFVHMDSVSMGLGGVDSWNPNVSPEFLIDTGALMETKLLLVPVGETDEFCDLYKNCICSIE